MEILGLILNIFLITSGLAIFSLVFDFWNGNLNVTKTEKYLLTLISIAILLAPFFYLYNICLEKGYFSFLWRLIVGFIVFFSFFIDGIPFFAILGQICRNFYYQIYKFVFMKNHDEIIKINKKD